MKRIKDFFTFIFWMFTFIFWMIIVLISFSTLPDDFWGEYDDRSEFE